MLFYLLSISAHETYQVKWQALDTGLSGGIGYGYMISFLRRLKPDVLKELPEKTEITLKVEMSTDEALLYEAQRLKAIENIENAPEKSGAF
jgi:hypothetical protein